MSYEIPKEAEKLTQKILVDSLRKRLLRESANAVNVAPPETAPALETPEPEITDTRLEEVFLTPEPDECGTVTDIPELIEPEIDETEIHALQLEAGKKYFRIGEVAILIGVEPYVLRYWESEFATIKPVKSGSGHRVYSRKDVETLHMIRHLLHVEKFSIKGAKKKLFERKKEVQASKEPDRQLLKDLIAEARELLSVIKEVPAGL